LISAVEKKGEGGEECGFLDAQFLEAMYVY
jgi:hypothetical protein